MYLDDSVLLQCRIGLISKVIVIGIVNPIPLFWSLSCNPILSFLVSPRRAWAARAMYFGCHSVCLSSREINFRSPNLNIMCSTATSLSQLMGKVTFYRTFVSRDPRKVWKVKKVRKTVFGPTSLTLHFRRSVKDLKTCQHIIFKTYA